VKPAFPQVVHDPLADDAKAQHSNIFSRPARHFLNHSWGFARSLSVRPLKITANLPTRNTEMVI
jgi:hypothetical protein